MRARHLAALFFLGAACSFVRDPERFSAGSGGSAAGGTGGTGAVGGSGASTCTALGEACTSNAQCCSTICKGTCSCIVAPIGSEKGENCTNDAQCCPGTAPRRCADTNEDAGTRQCVIENACVNGSDQTTLQTLDAWSAFSACDSTCQNASNPAECYRSCVANAEGLSEDCASCHARWFLVCTKLPCAAECASGNTAECQDCCTSSTCGALFMQCSGSSTCP